MKRTSNYHELFQADWAVNATVFTRSELAALLQHERITSGMAKVLSELCYSEKEDRHGDRRIEHYRGEAQSDWTIEQLMNLKRLANKIIDNVQTSGIR